jgi:PAS domain S-box-containing protein
MIFILDKQCSILRVNQSVINMFGWSQTEFVGKKCYEIFHNLPCDSGQSMDTNILCEFVDQVSGRCFSVQRSPLNTDEGKTVGYVSIFRDITERKKSEREKQQYVSFIDSILASSVHTAIIATDENLRVRYFNREADRLFCTDGQDMIGMSVNEMYRRFLSIPDFDSLDRDSLYEKAGRVLTRLQPGDVFEFSFQYAGKVIEARLSVITDRKGDSLGFLLMANDVTERARAEQEQQKMIQRLQKAEKMEAIGLMAGGVAHDLNNILSGIINYPELILMQMQGDEKWRDALESIRDSGLRAAAIVADLLTIARGVASEKVTCCMNTLITNFLASPEFFKLSERYPGIKVKTNLAPDLCACKCSEVHIQKSLMNLIANSFEAIEKSGTVTISTANEYRTADPNSESDSEEPVGKCIKIEITDTGKGISEEDARHMFEPFYSRKKMGHSGTGLGLAVVWNTVQDHQGSIHVQGSEQGTVMTLLLPSCENELGQKPADVTISGLEGQGKKVLVVDDEPLQRDVAGQMLTVLGYEVFQAANGHEAVEFIRSRDVDLVILDMIMEPGMNGRQTLEEILKIKPDQRTLIASGFAESSEVKKACLLGRTKLITKPYTLQKLGSYVHEAIAG